MPSVSVIIPIYNTEPFLRQCLDSIIQQTLQNIEIICVDDGSTDNSVIVLNEYAQQDFRVLVISQNNAGPGAARNTGLSLAKGDYVIFLDSDDWYEKDFLHDMVSHAQQHNADITICRAVEFDTNTNKNLPSEWQLKTQYLPSETFSPNEVKDYIFQFTYGMPWDKLYKREFLVKSELKFPVLKNSEDLAFVFPTILMADRIHIVNHIYIHHRINRMSSVSNSREKSPDDPFIAFKIVRDFMVKQNIYNEFEQSFLNWGVEFMVWHVSNMSDPLLQKEYLNKLRHEWLPILKFYEYPISYYRDRVQLLKLYIALYLPVLCFRGVVFTYKQVKKYINTR